MKTLPLALLTALVGSLLIRSQDVPVALPPTARIIGNIPDGTPPPPEPPKLPFVIPGKDIIATTAHEQGGRTITIRQISPIALA